ncbi:MAG: alpha-amylase family glycosyl hydrolase [Bacteroidota bacterium]
MELRKLLLVCLLFGSFSGVCAQDFMLQGWYWDYDKNGCNDYVGSSWASRLNAQVNTLDEVGFTYVWLPPFSRASFGSCSNGYDPKDLYDLGEFGLGPTGFGTRSEVDALIANLNARGMNAVADVVYNHRDGGSPEDNPAVKAYIETHHTSSKSPFPSDRFRCRLPLGGTYGAGDYYLKISSNTQSFGSNVYKLKPTIASRDEPFQGSVSESEPNGGGDCGQPFNEIILDQDMVATLFDFDGCYTDEFKLTISASDFDNAGDDLLIFLNNDGGYSDHRIYAIYYEPANGDPPFNINLNDLRYETFTDFTDLPSGQGGMNFENFKPNTANTATTFLNGDFDAMIFFYDVEQSTPSTATTYNDWTWWLHNTVGINGLRMDAIKHFPPSFVAQLLDDMAARGFTPGMVVGELFDSDAGLLANWVNQVNANITNSTALVRIFDFTLRDALKNACDNGNYDARNLFNTSLRDATALDGFSVVTFVNNHDFRKFGEPVQNDPLLAYAYILTNNQLGIPTVFYPDFFGTSIPNAPVFNGQAALTELMQIHRDHIFGATEVVYLNRFLSSQFGDYQFGSPDQGVIYQLKGGVGSETVIVAINFGYSTLKVDQEIDLSTNVNPGTAFKDLTGNAFAQNPTLSGQNRLLIDVPARSYAVYVVTEAALPVELSCFTAQLEADENVRLHWCSSFETQQAFYEVEVSENSRRFAAIGRVPARNQADTYDFNDSRPWNNATERFYRLRMVSQDGQEEWSPVQRVNLTRSADKWQLFPNPVRDQLTITGLPAATSAWRVLGVDGRQLSVNGHWQGDRLQLEVSHLPSGLYFFTRNGQTVRFVR